MDTNKIYVNGEWTKSLSGEYLEIENPADQSIITKVPRCNKEDVEKAIKAAREAFPKWSILSLDERVKFTEKIVEGLKSSAEEMAEIVVKELGSGYNFAYNTHIMDFINEAENFIKIAKEYPYEVKREKAIVRREPVGVVGCLTPWNFPLEQIIKKVIPSLLVGNTVVLKPSQITPLTAYMLTKIIDEASLPKGVFNLVTGKGSEIGNVLAQSNEVDMISFTGSTSGGREIGKLAMNTIKNLVLELGGKSAAIILPNTDPELGIRSVLDTVYLNTGQTCNAYTRLLVPIEEKSQIEENIIEITKEYKFGNPKDKSIDVGPLATIKQFEKVKDYIEKGVKENAKLLIGEIPREDNGYYVGPTVFTDVNNSMTIAQEEIFGPVLCIIPYETLDEAITIANDSAYGLAGAVFGEEKQAYEVATKLRTGSIYINGGSWNMNVPFGGYKQSGMGREGGVEGLESLMEIKTIYL